MKYCCSHCKKCWNYPVEKCIFCGRDLGKVKKTPYKVIGYSEVFIPSTGNEKVPYFINILEDTQGYKIFYKSFQKYEIGKTVELQEEMVHDQVVGIVGSGLMGVQLAAYFIENGFMVILKTRSESSMDAAHSKIRKIVSKRMSEDEVKKSLKYLKITLGYTDLVNCDLIIEAISENISIKKDIFQNLSNVCKQSTIFSTNSSSLSIDEIAKNSDRPEKCIGMHFFNPVQRMDLVEVVIGCETSEETKNFIIDIVLSLNKKPILVKNSPGYIVNRLLLPQINEAVLLLEEGVASKEDIDTAVKLGLNHPMGPFQLADFIGLDICKSILEVLYREFNNLKYKPSQLLSDMVQQGKLGFKTGEGFYKYR